MFDIDTYNQMIKEEKQVKDWEKSERSRILKITNPTRKQKEWSRVFPPVEKRDDSYILNGVIY